MSTKRTPADREADRQTIASQVAAFEAAGNSIPQLPLIVRKPKGTLRMTQILVGVVSKNSPHKLQLLGYFVSHLNIKHQSVEAPLINAISAATGVDMHTLITEPQPFTVIESVHCTIANLKARIKHSLEMSEPNFLINELKKSIFDLKMQAINSKFNGHLVSDINNEKQADFIRKNNGVIVHLVPENDTLPHPVKPLKNDFLIVIKNNESSLEKSIYPYCKAIKEIYAKTVEAA